MAADEPDRPSRPAAVMFVKAVPLQSKVDSNGKDTG